MESIYRISSEDVSQYLGNRKNEKRVFNQVRRSFSCTEELQVEENCCGKFLSYDIYRKDYYSSEKYTLFNLVSKAFEDRAKQVTLSEYFLDYFIRSFAEFLANGEAQTLL